MTLAFIYAYIHAYRDLACILYLWNFNEQEAALPQLNLCPVPGTGKGNVNESTKTPCGCGVFRLSAALLLSVSGRAGAERLFLFHSDQFDRFFACHVLDCDLNKTNLLKAFVNFP